MSEHLQGICLLLLHCVLLQYKLMLPVLALMFNWSNRCSGALTKAVSGYLKDADWRGYLAGWFVKCRAGTPKVPCAGWSFTCPTSTLGWILRSYRTQIVQVFCICCTCFFDLVFCIQHQYIAVLVRTKTKVDAALCICYDSDEHKYWVGLHSVLYWCTVIETRGLE